MNFYFGNGRNLPLFVICLITHVGNKYSTYFVIEKEDLFMLHKVNAMDVDALIQGRRASVTMMITHLSLDNIAAISQMAF